MTNHQQVELVFYASSSLLEGPHWDVASQRLYVVSIKGEMIYAIDTKTNEVTSYPTEGPVGCAVVDDAGMIISAEQAGIFKTDPQTKEKTYLTQVNNDERMRFNDGKLDPKGRFVVGTMSLGESYQGEAALYIIEKDASSRVLLPNITLSNGLAWTEDGRTMYYIDTPTKKVGKYAYDLEKGTATFEKYVIEITDGSVPDGMCIDKNGMLWVAQYGNGKVCQWNPANGDKLREILLPVDNVTSCCFGGADMSDLYITTAANPDKKEVLAGGLFLLNNAI